MPPKKKDLQCWTREDKQGEKYVTCTKTGEKKKVEKKKVEKKVVVLKKEAAPVITAKRQYKYDPKAKMQGNWVGTNVDKDGVKHGNPGGFIKGGPAVPFMLKGELKVKPVPGKKGDWVATSVSPRGKMLTWGYVK